MDKTPERQCISCRTQLPRDKFIRLTKIHNLSSGLSEIVVNPSKHQLGRSIYLCKSSGCIKTAIKEKKIAKMLRVSVKSIEKTIAELEAQNLREEVPA